MIFDEMKTSTIYIHDDKYMDWVFDKNHPTQGRRFVNAIGDLKGPISIGYPRAATFEELLRVHSKQYLKEVIVFEKSNEWSGSRPDLVQLALLFAGGTLVALDHLLSGKYTTAIHFPGAKHHAQYDHSSGFCIFADFALAADFATKYHGKKVAILDIDAHHGDGTENLTADNPDVHTFSIHQKGIFPGTGLESYPEKNVYNMPLHGIRTDENPGMGDEALISGVKRFLELTQDFKPDLLFIACGADGHLEDPLSNLEYSVTGYEDAAKLIRNYYPEMPILMGGAGGYLPDTRTPEVWATFANALSVEMGAK